MEFTLFISLIGLIRNLSKDILESKSNSNKANFTNYIQPMWASFKIVHEDYKESFYRYIEMVKSNKSLSEIRSEIRQDSIYSADLRGELRNLIEITSNDKSNNKMFTPFLLSINNYISLTDSLVLKKHELLSDSNIGRNMLIAELSLSGLYSIDRKAALHCIERTLIDFQNRYNIVDKEYYRLKISIETII